MTSSARAFTVGRTDAGWTRSITTLPIDELGDGEVLVRVAYSGINFKDGLASSEGGRVARIDPLVPGVDLAGEVVESSDPSVAVGTPVIAHGYDIGVAHHGGFAEYARVKSDWVVPMPAGLDARQSMAVGTAGYTAALSVDALERAGLQPGAGPVVVTGATGGVGSMAVGMLAARGHHVVAATGKASAADWLRALGAAEVIDRSELTPDSMKPLERERWAGAVDCVGGITLGYLLRTLRYGASVAASGLTGGTDVPATVLPFILRGVNLLGINSSATLREPRLAVWARIATDLMPQHLDRIVTRTVDFDALPGAFQAYLDNTNAGRTLVRIGGET